MVFEGVGRPLVEKDVVLPLLQDFEVLLEVEACGVCRTDLHIIEGDLKSPKLPLILGHQIVGYVKQVGGAVSSYKVGDRVGVPWLGGSCGSCEFCSSGRENLCDKGVYTGYTRNGGYAEFAIAHEAYCLPLPQREDAVVLAPLLCAGLIGYRGFRLLGSCETIGFYGFGSSAHILTQLATALGRKVYAFTRPGDTAKQAFAKSLGAVWAGGSDELPPELLDGALIFAPTGSLYPQALRSIKKGGRVISTGIHMSDIPSFPYDQLFWEKSISSVSNLTRQDGKEFFRVLRELSPTVQICPKVQCFSLTEANEALALLQSGAFDGSIVLKVAK